MILAMHAIAGAAAGRIFPSSPLAAFLAGLVSHYLLDSIPHWQYGLRSLVSNPNDPMKNEMNINADFLRDLLKISLDFGIGIAAGFLLFRTQAWPPAPSLIFGIAGGVLPDALQFFYYRIRREPLVFLQKIQHAVDPPSRPPLRLPSGFFVYLATFGIILAATFFFAPN